MDKDGSELNPCSSVAKVKTPMNIQRRLPDHASVLPERKGQTTGDP